MTIYVNGQEQRLDEICHLDQLLQNMDNLPKGGIAVAVNNTVVSKSCWQSHQLNPGDKVLIIKASQGG